MGEGQKYEKSIFCAVARQPSYHSSQAALITTNVKGSWGTNM